MAKKKVTNQSKDTTTTTTTTEAAQQPLTQDFNNKKTTSPPPPMAMEEDNTKLLNLKTLNSILLKETIEKRHLVDSLHKSIRDFEAQLTRSVLEKREVETELTRSSEEAVCLSMEKDLFTVFIKTQIKELGFGIQRERGEVEGVVIGLKSEVDGLMKEVVKQEEMLGRVSEENELLKGEVDVRVKERNGLREEVLGLGEQVRRIEDEKLSLRKECEGLVLVRKENEEAIEALKRDKDLVTELKDKEGVIDGLKKEVDRIMTVLTELENVYGQQKVKICDLEMELGTLDEIVLSLKKEKETLTVKVVELEKRYDEVIERENNLNLVIQTKEGDNQEKQRTVEKLMEEKTAIGESLEVATRRLQDSEEQMEELIRVKGYLQGVKLEQENDIVLLHKEIGDLRNGIIAIQEKDKDKESKIKELTSEVNKYKDAYEKATFERNTAQKSFDEEKKNATKLMSEISEKDKSIQETTANLAQFQNDYDQVIAAKIDLENRVGLLVQEKEMVQKNFEETKHENSDLKAKLESISAKSEKALTLLKNTTAMFRQSKEGANGKEPVANKQDRDIEPYAAELEAIESAFRNKDAKMEDMKNEIMKNLAAEKKKTVWTCVTSATLFAVASFAYAVNARAH